MCHLANPLTSHSREEDEEGEEGEDGEDGEVGRERNETRCSDTILGGAPTTTHAHPLVHRELAGRLAISRLGERR